METNAVQHGEKKSPSRKWLIAACLCLVPFLMTSAMINPGLGAMRETFAGSPDFLVQNISTAEALSIFLVGLLFGMLSNRIASKTIAIVGIFISLVSTLVCGFAQELILLVIMRFFSGIGTGLIYPLVNRVIFEFFLDPDDRTKILGWKTTTVNATGIVFSLIGGFISVIDWHYIFFTLMLLALPGVITIWKLPTRKPAKAAGIKKARVPARAWYWIIVNGVGNLMATAFMVSSAIAIVSLGIGTGAEAGLAISLNGVFGVVAGLVFPYLRKLTKHFTLAVVVIIYLTSFVVAATANSITMMYIAGAINGFAFGTWSTEIVLVIQKSAGDEAGPAAMGYFSASLKLGTFFMPYLLAAIVAVTGFSTTMMATWAVVIFVLVLVSIGVPLIKKVDAEQKKED